VPKQADGWTILLALCTGPVLICCFRYSLQLLRSGIMHIKPIPISWEIIGVKRGPDMMIWWCYRRRCTNPKWNLWLGHQCVALERGPKPHQYIRKVVSGSPEQEAEFNPGRRSRWAQLYFLEYWSEQWANTRSVIYAYLHYERYSTRACTIYSVVELGIYKRLSALVIRA
jgi:hypothetical protein